MNPISNLQKTPDQELVVHYKDFSEKERKMLQQVVQSNEFQKDPRNYIFQMKKELAEEEIAKQKVIIYLKSVRH